MRAGALHARRAMASCLWAAVVVACLVSRVAAQADVVEEARGLQRRLQYADAQRLLVDALPALSGEPRARAALLLAELTTDHKEARRFLREAQQAGYGGDLQRRAELELGRLDFARGNYNSVRSRLEPYADAEAQLLVATSWVALENAAPAAATLQALPPTPRTRLLRCWAARAGGDTTAALGDLTALAATAGDFQPTVLLWKAECEAALGRPQEALATAADLQRRFPTAPECALLEPTLQRLRQPAATGGPSATSAAPVALLQLGAFETRANALRLRDKLPPDLGPVRVDEVRRGDRRFFRVSIGPFESTSVATEYARTHLEPRGFEWRLVAPEPP